MESANLNLVMCVVIILTILGCLFSIAVILTFRRKQMQSSVVSPIFVWISVCDLAASSFHLIKFCCWLQFSPGLVGCLRTNYVAWYFQQASLWLETLLATVRYVAVAFPLRCPIWCSRRNVRFGAIGCFLICVFANVLIYVTFYSRGAAAW